MAELTVAEVIHKNRERLNSVGLVCSCGRAIATIEGVVKKCECGAVWLITAMRLDRG